MSRELLNVPRVAQWLGIKDMTLRIWVWRGEIPYVKIGRLVKFEPEAIQKFIEENRVSRTA